MYSLGLQPGLQLLGVHSSYFKGIWLLILTSRWKIWPRSSYMEYMGIWILILTYRPTYRWKIWPRSGYMGSINGKV
jgi:hypothetical protein